MFKFSFGSKTDKTSNKQVFDSSRVERLGYSLCAMLDMAKQHKLYEVEDNFPIIPELLPIFSKASAYFLNIIESSEPNMLETLMHYSCRYLWGKSIEAAILWGKSHDGNISINFEPREVISQTITTNLPPELHSIVLSSMNEFLPYFNAHQNVMIQNQGIMSPDYKRKEIIVTLEYLPKIGIAYALSKNYHKIKW